jgi:hypothetical protein
MVFCELRDKIDDLRINLLNLLFLCLFEDGIFC